METKKIKTYICTLSLGMFEMQDSENGNFVDKSEYDALLESYNKLLLKNESLSKAGDSMANVINNYRCNTKHGNALDKMGGFRAWLKWKHARVDEDETDISINCIEDEE